MAISKVILNGTTLMDVTQDTVASNNLLTGYTAHGADGDALTGEYAVPSGTINILQNGVVDVTSYASANVNVSGGGTVEPEEKDVNFYDYDGVRVASYTAADFSNLSAMPSNPSHAGLTAQGWNWTLANAKSFVSSNGKLDVGQSYVTSDGKTRIYCLFDDYRKSPTLSIAVNGSVTVDWGDGTSTSSLSGTSLSSLVSVSHAYSSAGSYCISVSPSVGATFSIMNTGSGVGSPLLTASNNSRRAYQISIRKIELGNGVSIGAYAFQNCYSLEAISIPSNITTFGTYAFGSCRSLKGIVLPNGFSSLGSYAIYQCYDIKVISMPLSLTDVAQYALSQCYNLERLVLSCGASVLWTQVAGSCARLKDLTISNAVTEIKMSAFNGCYGLTNVTIPSSVTTIGSSVFLNTGGIAVLRFKGSSPPTVSATSTFQALPTDCIIYVPRGSLSAYTSASNYPSSSTYTYIEY